MAHEYAWAQNQMKLGRAIDAVKLRIKAGEKIEDFEAEVKAQYVKYLGHVLEVDVPEEIEAPKAPKVKAPKASKNDE
jgi:hypothetical protein